MTSFTPLAAIAGGCLIGIATVLYLVLAGRYAGLSGILRGAVFGDPDRFMDVLMIAGLVAGGWLWSLLSPHPLAPRSGALVYGSAAAGGVLVGFGTALGGGCTSGHGVCGLGRLSSRSLVAVLTFLAAGVLTVFIVRHVIGAHA
jgi:uncharacterized membrane protein YedE/YeeE